MAYNPNNPNGQATMANSAPVVVASDQSSIPINDASGSLTVDNGNLSSIDSKITVVNTGAVVVSSSVLPTGAATAAKQPALGTAGSASTDVITVQGIASGTAQPVSAASLPLPSGASTSAKQPALGTAGTPSTDVLTVQGATSMTALKTDGSGVTQPVSGTVAVSSISTSVTPGVAAANLGKAEDAAHASGDTGVFALGVRNDGAATAFASANGDYTPIGTDNQGRIYVVQKAPTATLSNVSTSTTNATLLASNTARIGAQIFNEASVVMYVKFGATASATSYTVQLATNTYYEVPAGYTGQIDGILASGTGTARVTEET
jgi:hypothetical protein